MRLEKLNVQRIRTPEGVVFSLPLAGVSRRFVARLIDWGIVGIVLFGFYTILAFLARPAAWLGDVGSDFVIAVAIAAFFFITNGYNIVLEWFWQGQTVGKKMMRLRVMDEFGLRLRFNQIMFRNLLRAVDWLPLLYFVGAAATALGSRSQRLGDLAANTIVVSIPHRLEPDWSELFPDKYNSFREHPHLVARLRQAVSPREAEMAVRSLMRRHLLEPVPRTRLFAELAAHFRGKVKFPEGLTLGLSDEKYVRNVVEIVLRHEAPDQTAAGNEDGLPNRGRDSLRPGAARTIDVA